MIGSHDGGLDMAERTITISDEDAEAIDRLLATGRIRSPSDVILVGLLAIEDERGWDGDPEFERWLREEVVPAMDRMRADPDRGIPAERVLAELEARRDARRAMIGPVARTG